MRFKLSVVNQNGQRVHTSSRQFVLRRRHKCAKSDAITYVMRIMKRPRKSDEHVRSTRSRLKGQSIACSKRVALKSTPHIPVALHNAFVSSGRGVCSMIRISIPLRLDTGFDNHRKDTAVLSSIAVRCVGLHHFLPYRGMAHVVDLREASAWLRSHRRMIDATIHRSTYQKWVTTEVATDLVTRLHPRSNATD